MMKNITLYDFRSFWDALLKCGHIFYIGFIMLKSGGKSEAVFLRKLSFSPSLFPLAFLDAKKQGNFTAIGRMDWRNL